MSGEEATLATKSVGSNKRWREEHGLWFTHWRRGLRGAIRSWARGSRDSVVAMLASLARAFGVAGPVLAGDPPLPCPLVQLCE